MHPFNHCHISDCVHQRRSCFKYLLSVLYGIHRSITLVIGAFRTERETWEQNRCCYAPLKHFDHKSINASLYTRGCVYITMRANVMMNMSTASPSALKTFPLLRAFRLSRTDALDLRCLRFICTVQELNGFICRT